MPDHKKLDDCDILISDDISPDEHKVISEYLKAHRAKQPRQANAHSMPSARKKPKARAKH